MPRYFFHTADGRAYHDDDGTELAGDEAAQIEAARMMGQLLNEQPREFWAGGGLQMTVTNASGLILFVVDVEGVTSPSARPANPAAPSSDGSPGGA
jgi:hypothetical protein